MVGAVSDEQDEAIDPEELVERFRERARRVRERPVPPVAGEERQRYLHQAEIDFMDFSIIADAEPHLEDGILTLRVDLRPSS